MEGYRTNGAGTVPGTGQLAPRDGYGEDVTESLGSRLAVDFTAVADFNDFDVGMKVSFRTPTESFAGMLIEGPISRAIVKKLPISSTVQRWGDEIYFDVPIHTASTAPTTTVRVGDIAYWPDGPCLCIFFGKTPASKGDEPRPASDVTVVGHTDAPVDLLRSITEGMPMTLDMY